MSEIKIRRGDGFEATELNDTMLAPGVRRIEARLRMQREQCITELIASKSWELSLRLQGQIEAIERSINVPYILRSEDAANQKKND